MKTKVEKLQKSAIKITVTVGNDDVKKSYEEILEEAAKFTQIEGFRKGTAPKAMVEEKVGVSKLYGEVINDLLQKFYPQALKENSISPVSNPKVEIKDFDIEKEFVFEATIATKPEIKIGDYKKALKQNFINKYNQAKKDLDVKRKEEEKKSKEKNNDNENDKEAKVNNDSKLPNEPHVHMGANEVIDVLVSESKFDIADVLVEEETQRMLERVTEQIKQIGLSLDQYLKAQDKTFEGLQKEYTSIAEKNIKAEFILAHLIKEENIEIEDKEIDEMINALGDEKMKESFKDPMQRLYVKSILQKNKLISQLIELSEGEHHHEHK